MGSGPAIAIIHYHLRGGGVTRVIQQACEGLEASGASVVVLAGEHSENADRIANVRVIDGLGYDQEKDAGPLLTEVQNAAAEALGREVDLWHVHNHCLGKNVTIPAMVSLLAEQGAKILLQPHDFAEDGRPEMYRYLLNKLGQGSVADLAKILYPSGDTVHYGVINLRDKAFLQAAGLAESNVHYLPNTACLDLDRTTGGDIFPDAKLFLYPARAIRRKNIGEFLIHAAVGDSDDVYGITMAPKNPFQRPVYDRWVQFADEMKLPVRFGLGDQYGFADLYNRADAIVSTSVAEGFGLAFLEPWLMDKPLAGRDLPEVTGGLKQFGLELSALYGKLEIPIDWIGRERFVQTIETELEKYMAACGRQSSPADVEAAVSSAISGDRVDAGCLNEQMQEQVIRKLCQNPAMRTELAALQIDSAPIASNRTCVETRFGRDDYVKRLLETYDLVLSSPSGKCEHLNGESLLDSYTDPARFSLIRALQ